MQSEVASRFSDVGASPEDDRERDAVADCTVDGGVHRAAEAGILFEPKFSSWGKELLCQAVDVDPITVFGNFKNG